MRLVVLLMASILASIMPLRNGVINPRNESASFSKWPETFAGRELERVPLSEREKFFKRGFPGDIARFSDGRREIVMRWVKAPTRKLHPASDCFRAIGYKIKHLPHQTDLKGIAWGCFQATRLTESLRVCEKIFDESGTSWTDPSSWFWAAILKKTQGPWWAITVAENFR